VKRGPLLLSLAVLAVAAGLRLHNLGTWSLDGDELYSHYDVQALLAGEWREGARSHPLGYLAMAAGVALLGPGAAALRLLPALSGLGAVACLLFLRRDAVSQAAALVAGALAAISPWLVYHSQEARFYGPLLLCATLATLWALPGASRRPLAATVAWFAAMLCHTSALLLGPCLLLGQLRRRPSARQVAIAVTLGGAAFAAWMVVGGGAVLDVVRAAVRRSVFAHYDAMHFVKGLAYNLGLGVCVLLVAGAWPAWRRRSDRDRVLLLAALVPPAALLVAALLGVSMQQRYAMASVPAALLLAGEGAVALSSRRPVLAAAGLLAVAAPLPELLSNLRTGDRADYREAAAWIAAHVPPGDLLIADEHALLQLYLAEYPDWADTLADEAPFDEDIAEKRMKSYPRHRKDSWVVLKSSRLQGHYGDEFMDWLHEWYEPVARLGAERPPLAVHDNTLQVFHRRERLVGKPP